MGVAKPPSVATSPCNSRQAVAGNYQYPVPRFLQFARHCLSLSIYPGLPDITGANQDSLSTHRTFRVAAFLSTRNLALILMGTACSGATLTYPSPDFYSYFTTRFILDVALVSPLNYTRISCFLPPEDGKEVSLRKWTRFGDSQAFSCPSAIETFRITLIDCSQRPLSRSRPAAMWG